PPTPIHLIRSHASPVSAVCFSDDNERIYSGDSSGLVVITSTRSLRALASWNAHTDGILGIQEWNEQLITHSRDHKLHVWKRPTQGHSSVGDSALLPGLPNPALAYSMDVNSLNYCRFSLLPLGKSSPIAAEEALIALPNLIESSLADIWMLPSQERIHAAIGKGKLDSLPMPGTDGRGIKNSTGIIMSMHLLPGRPPMGAAPSSSESRSKHPQLLTSYENGSVSMWQYSVDKEKSIEGIGWERLWSTKMHVESGLLMAMAASANHHLALSVSADHLIARYNLAALDDDANSVGAACTAHRTKRPGNGSIALREDGRVCAVGGWDGKIRLYSAKTLKPLGTLVYHKDSVQAIAWARLPQHRPMEVLKDCDSEDDMSSAEKENRERWLVSGGKDGRLAIWGLMEF
ncbi:hypothetical protein HETIRDRAFT_238895, partial [Heterobasidion irregulare TC 32-1]